MRIFLYLFKPIFSLNSRRKTCETSAKKKKNTDKMNGDNNNNTTHEKKKFTHPYTYTHTQSWLEKQISEAKSTHFGS